MNLEKDMNVKLSLKAYTPSTRATSFTELPITSVTTDDINCILSITASCSNLDDDFYYGLHNMFGFLSLSDGISEISSNIVRMKKGSYLPYVAGHSFVDLALPSKTLWATMNVGAITPEDFGDYYAWGEINQKDTFYWKNYKHCIINNSLPSNEFNYNLGDIITKYNNSGSYGNVDNKTALEPSDDAAYSSWGGIWKMPTADDWQELYNNCYKDFTTQNGVNGCIFKSKINGNSLFIPAGGRYDVLKIVEDNAHSWYWSSSLLSQYPTSAYSFGFYNFYNEEYERIETGFHNTYGNADQPRFFGLSIRPVCHPEF